MAIKRQVGKRLFLYKDRLFPSCFKRYSSLRYRVIVGIGGNIGDVRRRFIHLIYALKRINGVDVIKSSVILKNPPFGYEKQDDFYNCVIEIKTSKNAHTFLDFLLNLERRFGRKRSFASAPRTLDLDIIFFDAKVINTERLSVPHPHWSERESVVIPLSYM
jgi:2-amino-4-hydroxy-6-hydroxymethyldihydropteridine diphosphokinase